MSTRFETNLVYVNSPNFAVISCYIAGFVFYNDFCEVYENRVLICGFVSHDHKRIWGIC